MAICAIEGSFRVPADATIRITRDDTAATYDWVVPAGQVFDCVQDLVSTWQDAMNGSASFTAFVVEANPDLDTYSSTVTVTTGGPDWSVAWSHAGDGSAIRDWLGASGDISGAADGDGLGAIVPAVFVANYGARVTQTAIGRDRSHFVSLSGTHQTQHHSHYGQSDNAEADVVMWWGATGATYAGHERLEGCVDAVFDYAGAGEPWCLIVTGEDNSLSDGERYVLRFIGSPVELRPVMVPGSRPGRLWELTFSAAVAG